MRLAFNAVSIAPGGGLNGVIGYLESWRELGVPLEVTVYASRPSVLEAVKKARADVSIVPFAVGASPAKHYFLVKSELGKQIEAAGADVILSTPTLVGRCHVPQVMHHRNLKRFLDDSPLRLCLKGQVGVAMRDLSTRRSVRLADRNVFISEYLRREAERFIPESAPRNHVVYNGISSEILKSAQSGAGWNGEPHLMAVQSEAVHKDNPTLLRALRYVIDREPMVNWTMTISGDADWSAEEKLARELGLADRVHFAGYLTHAQMESLLRRSVCLVFTSILEGFGNPPIEAMARSCPTIACNVTAMPEVIGDAGLLVEPHRHDQFGDAILRLYHDHTLRDDLVARGLERVKRFTWSASAEKMYRLLGRPRNDTFFLARMMHQHEAQASDSRSLSIIF